MAQIILIFWRDIPAQVVVKQGRAIAKVHLPPRFQAAIDRAAMRAGKTSASAYLEDWKRGAPRACGDDLEAEATAEAARLDLAYSDHDLLRLIRAKGLKQGDDAAVLNVDEDE